MECVVLSRRVRNNLPAFHERVKSMCQDNWTFIFSFGSYFSLEYFCIRLGRFCIGGKKFQDYFPQDIVECTPEDRVTLDMAKAVGENVGRRLIILESGHFGLVPNAIKLDDLVLVIKGCSLPVIWQHIAGPELYQVVNKCYFDRFSKGVAIKLLDERQYRFQEIRLC
jgi:hypothetical protein